MNKVRFGIIGCGAVSVMRHIPALKKSKKAQLIAAVDTDREQLARIQKQFGVKYTFKELEKLEGLVDAVLIATPNAFHYDMTKAMLEQSVHVLCDKPLALTFGQAEDLYQISSKKNKKLTVSYNRRFSSRIQTLHSFMQMIKLPLTITLSLGGDVTRWPARSGFRFNKEFAGGGCLIDTGSHIIDLATYFLGAQIKLKSFRIDFLKKYDIEDNVSLVLQSPSGSIASLACSYTFGLKPYIHIAWDGGWAHTMLDGESDRVTWFIKDSLMCKSDGIQELLTGSNDEYMEQIDHFCDCITKNISPLITKDEVLIGSKIIDQVYAEGIA